MEKAWAIGNGSPILVDSITDDDRESPAVCLHQKMIDQRGLSGAEEPDNLGSGSHRRRTGNVRSNKITRETIQSVEQAMFSVADGVPDCGHPATVTS